MPELIVSSGKTVLVDMRDWFLMSLYSWSIGTHGYAMRHYRDELTGKKICELMHRNIMQAPDNMQVDHINGNRLDNRRSNLRLCSPGENLRNRSKRAGCKLSKFKGVTPKKSRWHASVSLNGNNIYLGSFKTELEAAKAYDEAAKKYYGEFANLNLENNDE